MLLAVAWHKQGQSDKARRALDQAVFVLEREASMRQALALFGSGARPFGCPPLATIVVAGSAPAVLPRWDWPTELEIRLFRREAETLLKEKEP